uniref:Uncharacterized protein n=1 Tax=Anguilla anguilla TaxID=7936 RepID=A0A0E9R0J2_ANGAN
MYSARADPTLTISLCNLKHYHKALHTER